MSARRLILVAAAKALAVVGCASLVGVPDVPNPVDSGGGATSVYESGSSDGGGAVDSGGALDGDAGGGE